MENSLEKINREMKSAEESLGISSEKYNDIVNECLYGESNSSDKVEPKFHEGDYVVDNSGYIWKIEGILNQFYILEGVEGGESRPTMEWVNKTFHLWTIQDAKNGDVLVNGTILMIVDHLGTFENRPIIYSWYFADSKKFYGMGTSEPDRWEVKGFTPATKEQRDLLFTKMQEDGYEWDAEKKELREIHVIDEGKAEMDYCFTKMMNGEKINPIWSKEDELRIRELESLVKQEWAIAERENDKDKMHKMSNLSFFLKTLKPQLKREWSKEDLDLINGIIIDYEGEIEHLSNSTIDEQAKYVYQKRIDFLNRLKSFRPQSWTKEDKERYISCLQRLGTGNPDQPETINSKWFKEHVYPQKQWKPNEEQMKALSEASGIVGMLTPRGTNLQSLYNDLKKLTE